MKLKEGFVLRKMPGMNIVMPVGTTAKDFRKTEIYGIDLETAERAVKTTVKNLIEAGLADV